MLDTDKVTNFKKVTTKDLQDSICQNIAQKYGKRFYNYLLKHNRSEDVYVYLSRLNSILAVKSLYNNEGDYIIVSNPKITKRNSELNMKQFYRNIADKFTFANLIAFAKNMDNNSFTNNKSFYCNVIDEKLYFDWVMSNFETLLFATGIGHRGPVYFVLNYFNESQNNILINYILVNFKKVQKIIKQNHSCLDTLLEFVTHVAKTGKYLKAPITLLLQKLIDETVKHHYNPKAEFIGPTLNQIDNLRLKLPINFFEQLVIYGNNPHNHYHFIANSEQDVDTFLAATRYVNTKTLRRNIINWGNCIIDLNGFEQKVADYRQGLIDNATVFSDCLAELDKLDIVLDKK